MKTALLFLSFTFIFNFALAKGDAKAGSTKAAVCAACHGPNGMSTNDLWPNLKGQKQGYLLKQLKDFKVGNRKDPLMSPQAKLLSEQDMEDLAAYFSEMN